MKRNFEASRSYRAISYNIRKTKPGEGDFVSNLITFCATIVNKAVSPLWTCFLISHAVFM